MSILNRKEPLFLLCGDIILFLFALWLMLVFRYGELPSAHIIKIHLLPFSLLFLVWIGVFFIAGLYEKHTLIFRSRLPQVLLRAELVNSLIAVLFFYFVPYFGIAPKINLFIYLIISFICILLWRSYSAFFLNVKKKQNAVLIGSGAEMRELETEVNGNSRYSIRFVTVVEIDNLSGIDFNEEVLKRIYADDIAFIVVDLRNKKIGSILPRLYSLIFSRMQFIDMHKMYEEIFDRVPLSLIEYSWFLENISLSPKITYDVLKRLMDITVSLPLGMVSLVLYPFVYLAILMDDGGKIFSIQERVGRNNRLVRLCKFRTMSVANDGGKWGRGNENQVTRVGAFLRRSRLDEFPQLWNVLKGDISLIGPRPEFPEPVKLYEEQVPYYNIRHLIKPGLSGWAQMYHDKHPHHSVNVDETRTKLSYDLYYIKNRSFLLDLIIALKTIKILLSRSGL